MSLLKDLNNKILIGDGAMGTLLYAEGVDHCYEELNLSAPDKIQAVHKQYVEAGANVIQTNTYAANRLKLLKYGLENRVKDINQQAVQLAKSAVKNEAYVVGTIGGMRGFLKGHYQLEEIKTSFQEQINDILSEAVDGLLFETFYDLEELQEIIKWVRTETDIPIIAQVSLGEIGVLPNGTPVKDALASLVDLGADVVGMNCRMGPSHMIRSFEEVPIFEKAILSAYPNASLPDYRDGRFFYQSNPTYFGESALQFREQGIRLLGGCCGTTPEHIEAMADALKGLPPIKDKDVKIAKQSKEIVVKSVIEGQTLAEKVKKEHSVIVELDPPKQLSIEKFMEGAKRLHLAGVDAVTMADNSLASPRVDNMALAALMKERVGARPLVHVTCRDRNLIGLQSHLMGLATLGINEVLAITGDPTKVGDFPGATSVYDLSSFELIRLIKQLNEGISFSGKSLGQKANFSIGAAFNPNVRHLDKAVQRMEKKIDAGADYFMSQPIYSEKQLEEVYEATKHLKKPLYVGIMPLISSRNAEFLHNEVPGIKLTDEIRARMAECGNDKEKAAREGIAIAKSLLDTALQYFQGIYLITPFLRYEMTVELTNYIHEQIQHTKTAQH